MGVGLHLPGCMISSNDQIGQLISWEKTFISHAIKWFNKTNEYT